VRGTYDLSRRAAMYFLPGLSFREYLNFRTGSSYPVLSFDDVTTDPAASAELALVPRLKGHFQDYLAQGYYPFVFEAPDFIHQRLQIVIDKTIFEDIANFYNLKTANLHLFKKILYFLSTIPPGEINFHSLAKNLRVDDKTAQQYVTILAETGLVRPLLADRRGGALIRKPRKLYLDNPSLYHSVCHELGHTPDRGTLRELFFITSLSNAGEHVAYSEIGDSKVRDIVFEIGGPRKGRRQIRDASARALVIRDDVLTGSRGIVPLYLFGFLY